MRMYTCIERIQIFDFSYFRFYNTPYFIWFPLERWMSSGIVLLIKLSNLMFKLVNFGEVEISDLLKT